MNKEVIIISSSLNLGGAESQAVELANKLERKLFKVSFYSLKQGIVLKKNLNSNINLREFKIYSTKNNNKFSLGTFYWWLKGVKQLRAEIRDITKKDKPVVVISFMFHSWVTGFVSTLFIRSSKHIISVRSNKITGRSSNTKILRYILYLFVSTVSALTVFNSISAYNLLGKHLKNTKKTVISNFLKESKSTNINFELDALISNNLSAINILSIGRLDRLKNYRESIKAVSLLKKKGIEVSYFIFGEGQEKENLNSLIKLLELEKNVFLVGAVENIELFMNHFKFLLLTSTHESFPNVVVEAMNNELFVIATKVGDVPLLLENDRGILIEGFNSNSIFNSIEKFLDMNNEDLNKVIKKNKIFINNYISNAAILKKWISLI